MSGAETAESLLARAARLREAGRVPEAIHAYHRFLTVRPASANAWFNLAWLQRQARDFEGALASYGEALARGVEGPEEVHLNRALILADDLARPQEAERELLAALHAAPDYLPALLNLGNIYEDLGNRPAAREAYGRAVASAPESAVALARLAGVKPVDAADDGLTRSLRTALARPGLDAADRADLGFALGRRLDEAGAYDEAFAVFGAANEASRAAAGPGGRYDRAAAEAFIDRLIAAFPAPEARSETTRAPVFICGMFRSGSTLAEQILAGHRSVTAGGELNLLPVLTAQHIRPYPEGAADAGAVARLRDSYLEQLRGIHPAACIVTDKRPDNFLHIGLIKRLFPDAKIIHTLREPLDNILSVYFLHLDPAMSYGLDLADMAHWYRQYRRLMAHWKSLYPADIHDLDYDALVTAPKPSIEELLAFLELHWEERCLSFHTVPGAVKTASVWQVRQPLYRRASGRWRNYERHLGPLREALQGL